MTASIIKKCIPQNKDNLIAKFAALAISIAVIDMSLPSPIPGVKPGLANIVTLLVLFRFGWYTALNVSLLRIVACGFLFGGFLSPGFLMSLTGGIASLFALRWVYRIPGIGPIGCSIIAAFAHITGQLVLARVWLIPHDGVWYLLPIFLLTAGIFGVVNGIIVARLLHTYSFGSEKRLVEEPLSADSMHKPQ